MNADEPLLTDADWRLLDDLRAGVSFDDIVAHLAIDERELRRRISTVGEKLRMASSLLGAEYVSATDDGRMRVPPMHPCPFCEYMAGRFRPGYPPAVVHEDDLAYVFLTYGPMGGMLGHALVSPRRHVETIFDLTEEEEAHLGMMVARTARLLRRVLDPHGLLVQQHNGAAAFQTVPHVHFHVVPKMPGPFPPVEPPTPISSDALLKIAAKLRDALVADIGPPGCVPGQLLAR